MALGDKRGLLHNKARFAGLFKGWGEMPGKKSEERLCAFCRLQHRVYFKKDVSLSEALLMLFITGLLAYAIWGGPDLRSLFIFMGMAFSLQVLLRVRYRASVKCPHCGFDPILYQHDQEEAAQKVKAFMEGRQDNPQFMLKPQPEINPIRRKSSSSFPLSPEQAPEENLSP